MPIALGSSDVSKIYLGSNEIDASYLGTDISFPEQDVLFTVDASIDSSLSIDLDAGGSYSGLINWGDGNADTILSGTGNTNISHTFASTGVYQVRVSGGSVPQLYMGGEMGIVSLENLGYVGLQNADSMFIYCSNLASANLGKSLTSIAYRMFANCTSLPSIIIPDSVIYIKDEAFSNCTSLTSVTIPDSVTEIWSYSFSGCTSLASILLPDNLIKIRDQAFRNCTSLTSITIPDSVTDIWNYTFSNCTVLATIDLSLPKSVIDAANGIFLNTASPLTLNVPTGTTGWTAGTGQSIGDNTNVTVNLV